MFQVTSKLKENGISHLINLDHQKAPTDSIFKNPFNGVHTFFYKGLIFDAKDEEQEETFFRKAADLIEGCMEKVRKRYTYKVVQKYQDSQIWLY